MPNQLQRRQQAIAVYIDEPTQLLAIWITETFRIATIQEKREVQVIYQSRFLPYHQTFAIESKTWGEFAD